MLLTEFITTFTASLRDSASGFKPEALTRHVQAAVRDYSRYRPLEETGTLNLEAGEDTYPAPDDIEGVLGCDWGRRLKAERNTWDDDFPGWLPELRIAFSSQGRLLRFYPAPTARQIALIGSSCRYRYAAQHVLTEQINTIPAGDEGLVLMRAQAEAMRELAIHQASRPVQLRDGVSSQPRNGTPGYLFEQLMAEFKAAVLS